MNRGQATADATHGSGSASSPQYDRPGTDFLTPLGWLTGPQLVGELTPLRKLREEAYFDLQQGLWARHDGEQVKVMIKIPRMTQTGSDIHKEIPPSERFRKRLLREISIWNTARDENILQFIGYQILQDEVLLVSLFCEKGHLLEYMAANPNATYTQRLSLLRGATRGLAYLHGLEPPIAHGSISPNSILVTDDFEGVLFNFDRSRRTVEGPTGLTTGGVQGLLFYMSKELIMDNVNVTPMCDIYGLGGTILMAMTGKWPFYQMATAARAIVAIAMDITPSPSDHPELPESDPLWSLMNQCWDAEPSERPSASQVVYKMNLILDCGSGFTAPLMPTAILTPETAPPDSEESLVQPGVSLPSLPEPLLGTLRTIECVGRGGYGEVHRGFWTAPGKDCITVAIKCLKMSEIGLRQAQNSAILLRRIRRETVIWKAAEHPNVLKLYGHQIVDGNPMLVSPWCKNGDLWSFVGNHPQLTRKERLKLLLGAGKALAHLHSLRPPICHGDVKPQNVIIGDNMEALLCDFGISRIITGPGITGMTTGGGTTGTAGFGAKEILQGQRPTEWSDVYAFGGLILATMTGKRPFYTEPNEPSIFIAIFMNMTPQPADYPQILPTDPLWSLMAKCWNPVQSRRPSMAQIIRDVTRGLAYLHGQEPPVVHGNIEPGGILIASDGRATLCENSYLRLVGGNQVSEWTAHGFAAYTPTDLIPREADRYLAKELLEDFDDTTTMSDVYALGGIILMVITGMAPYYYLRQNATVIAKFRGLTPQPERYPTLPKNDPLWRLMAKCWEAGSQDTYLLSLSLYRKINLILEFRSGLTDGIFPPEMQHSVSAPSHLEESLIQHGVTLAALPSPLDGTLTFTTKKPIASGGYSDVHKGSWTLSGRSPIPVAIKCIRETSGNGENSDIFLRRIKRETTIWKAAEHPNVLPFYGYQIMDRTPLLVSPWCENGNLHLYLMKHPEVTDVQRLTLLRGAAQGLAHLHSLEPPICHGDIKPQNLLVSDKLHAVWCDFGLSRVMVDGTGMTTLGTATGTPGYQAQELLFGPDERKTDRSDVYAFGGLILATFKGIWNERPNQTLTGKPPFYKLVASHYKIALCVHNHETPDPTDHSKLPEADPLWSLMRRCWSHDPPNRPSMVHVLAELEAEIESRSGDSDKAD
ncbi:hypothetical protein FRC01_004548 [Tulasnella sp. 417]|nr:hypothetical protein FRC01_004548 [Tulasnella sp. 417]